MRQIHAVVSMVLNLLVVGFVSFRWVMRTSAKPHKHESRLVLGYIRQSVTRLVTEHTDPEAAHVLEALDDKQPDMNSPDRQRANILAAAQRFGLGVPQIFEDADGHKSGASTTNRPGWLAVEDHIKRGEVEALIVNDLSRAHRKGWRIGQLIEWLEKYDVRLILAAPDREIDLGTLMGRMFLMFIAMVDEYYVLDASLRQKDNVARRRVQGKTSAMPPFGTVRRGDGYLSPSRRGAWLLADGRHVAGARAEPPASDAIWRGYHECARRILKLYAESGLGYERIAYRLSADGWVFRTKQHQPRPLDRDDVRRVIADWPVYAGLVLVGRAKDRQAHDNMTLLASAPTGRNVFKLPLLKRVAEVQERRTHQRRGDGSVAKAFPYPLVRLLYCAHCDQQAVKLNDPKLRKRLTGTKERYRHAEGIRCACHVRSLPMEIVHANVQSVLSTLRFCADLLTVMRDLAQHVDQIELSNHDDQEARRRVSVRRLQRRLVNLHGDYEEGELGRADYEERRQDITARIAALQVQASAEIIPKVSLLYSIDYLSDLRHLWTIASDTERQTLARLLFEDIVYDLDEQRIISYRLKAWLIPLLDAA